MAQTLEEIVKTERARLHDERKSILAQQEAFAQKLAETDRELAAIAAYEITKSGKFDTAQKIPTAGRALTKRPAGSRGGGRSGRRADILAVLSTNNPNGLTRGEIIEQLALKGNKSGEMSVSNALAGLTKGKKLLRQDGKYLVSPSETASPSPP
jgi:hypothetical protein